jgi:hypothetical protein
MPVQQVAGVQFSFTVEALFVVTCPDLPPPPYLLNQPFSCHIVGSGGVGPYTFFVKQGDTLPPGLTLTQPNPALPAVLSGTLTTLGAYNFTIQGRDTGV